MKYLLKYNESKEEIYQGLYVTPLVLDREYSQFLDSYDVNIRQSITEVVKFINNKYKDILVVKMSRRIQPGLIIKSGNIQHISTDIYHMFNDREIDVRIVYGEGTLSDIAKDIHSCFGKLVIKIGRYTDELKNKKGIFKA